MSKIARIIVYLDETEKDSYAGLSPERREQLQDEAAKRKQRRREKEAKKQ